MIRLPDEAVIAHLQGGLGNQLFQYAAVGASAYREGRPLLLDSSGLGGPRVYALGPFALDAEVLTTVQARRMPKPNSRLPWRRLGGGVNRVVQQGLGHGAQLDVLPPRAWVSGYWHSPLYFAHRREELRSTFALDRVDMSARARDVLARVRGAAGATVAVHVRRGDYVADPAVAAAHGVLGLAYFARGIDLAHADGARLPVIFSDDIDWARTHLRLPEAVYVEPGDSGDHEDLLLMAACDRHVLSNSSFSWWGAWLSPSGGLVVAPARWTRTLDLDVDTLLPREWVRLDA